ncbi:MAG: hypothetical protein R3296_12370 [Oleiphilaceae bacterium]|nr:hypothetical protein [Oleiphilaceae bacterium]
MTLFKNPSSFRYCLVLALVLILAGCGGGSGSESPAPAREDSTPQSVLDLPHVVMASGDTLIRDITRQFSNGEHQQDIQVVSDNEYVSGHYQQGILTLQAAQVDAPASSQIRLVLDGNNEEIVDFTVSVNPPSSATEVAMEANQLLDQSEDLTRLEEPFALYQHLLKLAYWGGVITYETLENRVALWQPENSGHLALLEDSLDQLYARKEGYRTGDGTSKEDLQAAIDQVYSAVQSHTGYADQRITALYDQAAEVLPEKPRFEYNYSAQTSLVSAYTGSGHSGYWEGDVWVFHPWMNFLEIVTKNLTSSACNLS